MVPVEIVWTMCFALEAASDRVSRRIWGLAMAMARGRGRAIRERSDSRDTIVNVNVNVPSFNEMTDVMITTDMLYYMT